MKSRFCRVCDVSSGQVLSCEIVVCSKWTPCMRGVQHKPCRSACRRKSCVDRQSWLRGSDPALLKNRRFLTQRRHLHCRREHVASAFRLRQLPRPVQEVELPRDSVSRPASTGAAGLKVHLDPKFLHAALGNHMCLEMDHLALLRATRVPQRRPTVECCRRIC